MKRFPPDSGHANICRGETSEEKYLRKSYLYDLISLYPAHAKLRTHESV